VFRRRTQQVVEQPPTEPSADRALALVPACGDPSDWLHDPAEDEPSDVLGRIAERFELRPWDPQAVRPAGITVLAEAIAQAAQLWTAPGPGELQRGVEALFGGRAPATLIGIRLWPVLVQSASGPALVLADIRHRVHVVVDVAPAPLNRAPRPGWTAAAAIAYGARIPGSHELWRHWSIELADHAPHEWMASCEDHNHMARPNAQGLLVTGIPQHDAWMMSRSWLPAELTVPSITDTRWVVLSASARPLRERERQVRSQWEVVSFADFATTLTAHHAEDPTLPFAVATIIRMLLPPDPVPHD
jgi:hypothetical protein